MSFIQQPVYLLAALTLLILFSEWLSTKKFFKHIGSATLVIIAGALASNLKIIPSSSETAPLYDKIFSYAAPIGIFFLLLEVKLKDLKLAGMPMLVMFIAGSLATVAGVLAGYYFLSPRQHIPFAPAIAGMFTGTYTGGSINLNAVALNYKVNEDGTLYAAVNAVDNILTTVWMIVTIFLPPFIQKWIPHKKASPPELKNLSEEEIREMMSQVKTETSVKDLSALLVLALGSLFIAGQIAALVPQIPSILLLTVFALVLAQLPFVHKLKGGRVMGVFLVMLFLVVIGAYCDIGALLRSGEMAGTLLAWDALIIFIHGLLIFAIAWIFRQDWDIVFVASNANIGGATSAPVCATSLGRPDLQLPGILAGSVGTAIGTFLGLLIAALLT